ncbi:MAG: hypothetical protein KME43_11390 [Myxacorys chilensis ATA2-1-KO14]|jgi:hypothetical protein|nr:hypothetical protein [Myxacorys chilensis ATA2-1-KO14]
MPNPRPKLENLKSFAKVGDRALSKRVIGTRYPEDVEAVLKAMPSDEMQQLIRAAVEKELRDRGLL